jgi:voltage-gated potassium channel
MKALGSELSEMLTRQGGQQRDLKTLVRFLILLLSVVILFSVAFHFLMLLEGQDYGWVTGFYWTLTVMSTLGFGDITFTSALGQGFTVIVLLTGIFLLLIVLPFVFIRYFYAPWLDEMQLKAPRGVSQAVKDHIIICDYDGIAIGLIERLNTLGVPYIVIQGDKTRAADLHREKVKVIFGDLEDPATYRAAGLERARMLVANVDDIINTNITIMAREIAPDTPVVATSVDPDALDVLELAGATHVLALRQQLGEQLANRVSAGHSPVHIVGNYRGLAVAEFPIRNTSLSGLTLRDAKVRERTGVTIAAVARRGGVEPGAPDVVLDDDCIGVAVAPEDKLDALAELLAVKEDPNPVLVIGGGKVGRSAALALKERGIGVNIIDEKEHLRDRLEPVADRVFVGDAADLNAVIPAGVLEASSVILTSNSDSMNIFLTLYCRKLNPDTIIVTRVAHDRNIEAIHRAGADFAVSDFTLGVHSILCLAEGRGFTLLGEGLDFSSVAVPKSLSGKTLEQAQIRHRTGLQVVGIEHGDELLNSPGPDARVQFGDRLLTIGTFAQRDTFAREFGRVARDSADAVPVAQCPAPTSEGK